MPENFDAVLKDPACAHVIVGVAFTDRMIQMLQKAEKTKITLIAGTHPELPLPPAVSDYRFSKFGEIFNDLTPVIKPRKKPTNPQQDVVPVTASSIERESTK